MSRFGNPQLVDTEGFIYNRRGSNVKGNRMFWLCAKRDSRFNCKARAITEGLHIVCTGHTGNHNHTSNGLDWNLQNFDSYSQI